MLANPCAALTNNEVMAAYGISTSPPQSVVDGSIKGITQQRSCRWTINKELFLEVRVLKSTAAYISYQRDAEAAVDAPTGVAPDSFKRTEYAGRTNPATDEWTLYRGEYQLQLDGCSNLVSDEDMPTCDQAANELGPIFIKRVAS